MSLKKTNCTKHAEKDLTKHRNALSCTHHEMVIISHLTKCVSILLVLLEVFFPMLYIPFFFVFALWVGLFIGDCCELKHNLDCVGWLDMEVTGELRRDGENMMVEVDGRQVGVWGDLILGKDSKIGYLVTIPYNIHLFHNLW